LRYAYLVTCTGFEKDENGRITEIRCVYDPESSGGNAPDGRKVRGTIHWISSENAREAEVRLYDRLFAQENPLKTEEGGDFTDSLNPDSLKVARGCLVEEHMVSRPGGYTCQFERHGYFCVDPESTPERPVFNRTITLKDSWARQQKR
ncbi:MAG TPA: glutamine--tRNA ligase, partial [Candidatus Sabulitectum sp.]|nr:glutamine--tRNA ligase [Candidatus Sabulitectum sp.]